MIPVFLGADVVSQTGVRTENHPKIHAKFSKKGLAARLTFSPGNACFIFFYSVKWS